MYAKSAATNTEILNSAPGTCPERLRSLTEIIMRERIQNGELASGDPRLLSWLYAADVTSYVERIVDKQNEILDFVIHLVFKGADSLIINPANSEVVDSGSVPME
jgi:hypothetical protein